jgi:hypothetical protein
VTPTRIVAPLLGLGLVVLLAGCGSSPGVAAPRTTPPTTVAPPTTSARSAPRVANPLDATKFVANPCTALTSAQLAGLGIQNPTTSSDTNGCTWLGQTGGGPSSIGWVPTNTNGLADLYVKKDQFDYWIPTTIAGYPAVFGDELGDLRSDGNCVLNVGVNDHQAFFIGWDDPNRKTQGCDLAAQMAADVIATIKGGS